MIRGGYGIFTSSFQGNISASSIVGPPYWSYETLGFSALSDQNGRPLSPGAHRLHRAQHRGGCLEHQAAKDARVEYLGAKVDAA